MSDTRLYVQRPLAYISKPPLCGDPKNTVWSRENGEPGTNEFGRTSESFGINSNESQFLKEAIAVDGNRINSRIMVVFGHEL